MQKIKTKLKKGIKDLEKRKYFNIYTIIIFVFSLFMFIPFISNYIYGDDTPFHVVNILARGEDLSYLTSKIVPLIGNNLGYGIGLFYPILPHALGGLFLIIANIFGFEAYAALKIVKFLIILASGLTMYMLATKLFKSQKHGLIASIIYLSSSYFFVDLFARDALNESCIFVFMPLVFLGLYYLFREDDKIKFYLCFILGYVGLMYSHLVLSVWFTLFLFVFLLLFIKEIFKKKNLIPLIISAIIILILTSTFTVPLIEHMILGEYVIFQGTYGSDIWTLDLKYFFVKIADLTGSSNLLFVSLNIIVILLSIAALVKLLTKKVPTNRVKFIIGFLIFGIMGIFFTSNDFIWTIMPDFLKNIQFPWRTCTFATIGFCLLAVEGLNSFYNLFKKKFIPVATALIIILLAFSFYDNLQGARLYKNIPIDMPAGMGWQKEYLPIETAENIEYFDERNDNKTEITQGDAKIKVIENDVPNLIFEVKNIKNEVTLELPRLYYLGYQIIDENGHKIEYFKNKNGFIAIELEKNGKYYVSYPGTNNYVIAKIVTFITITCIIILLVIRHLKNRKQNICRGGINES